MLNYPTIKHTQSSQKKSINSTNTNNSRQTQNNNNTKYMSLSFIKGLSTQFQKLFKKHDNITFYKDHNLLNNSFNKQNIQKQKKSNVVCKILLVY